MSDKHGDVLVLEQMVKSCADLTKAYQLEYFFYFPSRVAAERAAADVQCDGFTTEIHREPLPWWNRLFAKPRWTLLAIKVMVPAREEIFRLTDTFNAIGQQYGGEYDGWGALLRR
jgi:hypothetical protein